MGAQLLCGAVLIENFQGVGERVPEILKAEIHDVFKRVTIVIVQGHPGSFLSVIDGKVVRGNKRAGEWAASQNPTKLDTEDLKETVDMTRKVFM